MTRQKKIKNGVSNSWFKLELGKSGRRLSPSVSEWKGGFVSRDIMNKRRFCSNANARFKVRECQSNIIYPPCWLLAPLITSRILIYESQTSFHPQTTTSLQLSLSILLIKYYCCSSHLIGHQHPNFHIQLPIAHYLISPHDVLAYLTRK
jgi:hypothetical protein